MKTTIDLPDELLHRAKIIAAERKITLKQLIQTGLHLALQSNDYEKARRTSLAQLEKGLRFKGRRLSRDEIYERD